MTSILDNTSAMNHLHHHCGGTILDGPDNVYCDRCGAVAYYGDDLDAADWEEAVAALALLDEGEDNL